MWRLSSQALLSKQTVKVAQRRMSTVMSFGSKWYDPFEFDLPMEELAKAYKPTPIPSLPSDIVSVHAGYSHSFALTSQGQLWAWDYDKEGELNGVFSDRESWNEPKRVEGLEKVKVCNAFASHAVSTAIGDDGSVWVWGKSEHGQLGLGKHITEAVVPSRVEALSGENIAKVHSFYVRSKSKN